MKSQVSHSRSYQVLGSAFGRPDLWLVRQAESRQLALLQKFSRPFPALARMLAMACVAFPRVLDSWEESGATFVILERVEGCDFEPLTSRIGVASRWKEQLTALVQLQKNLGGLTPSLKFLCLTSKGQLRMRCLPSIDSIAA